jgi:DNA polymerase sigma
MLKRPEAMQIFHDEIVNFAETCDKSCAEALRCVRDVQRIASTIVSDAKVHLFGSQAAGLALSDSDIDIVVLSLSLPDVRADPSKKNNIVKFMQRMAEAIDSIEPKSMIHIEQMITKAAVPILKCITRSGRKCDLSFGVEGGLRAASLMKTEVQACPAIRPILLVLKQLLKEQDLNEVYRGGISSYGLFHMVLSYFSTRRQKPGNPDKVGGKDPESGHVVRVTDGSFPYFRKLAEGESPERTKLPGGSSDKDSDSDDPQPPHAEPAASLYEGVCLGQALLDVLERYGMGFDAVALAVHARRGLVPKAATRLEADRRDVGKQRFAVVDLLEPTHDVTSGSFNTALVIHAFTAARRALEAGQPPAREGAPRASSSASHTSAAVTRPLLAPRAPQAAPRPPTHPRMRRRAAAVRDTCAYRGSGVLGAALACAVRREPAGRGTGGKARREAGGGKLEEEAGGGAGGGGARRRRFEEEAPSRGGKKRKAAEAAEAAEAADSDGGVEWIADIPPSAARRPNRR